MPTGKEALAKYKKHFLKPPPEALAKRLEIFGVSARDFEKAPQITICGIRETIVLHPKKQFDPHIVEGDPSPVRFIHEVTPKSLEQLKELVGVPNRVLEKQLHKPTGPLRRVPMQHLPGGEKFEFAKLKPQQKRAVHDAAFNILYGHVDMEAAQRPPYRAITAYMLQRAAKIPTLVLKDLLVCPDQTVQFQAFGALYFNNVVVVGNGRIFLGDNTKLHAYQVTHV
jgi:hypothetical protein